MVHRQLQMLSPQVFGSRSGPEGFEALGARALAAGAGDRHVREGVGEPDVVAVDAVADVARRLLPEAGLAHAAVAHLRDRCARLGQAARSHDAKAICEDIFTRNLQTSIRRAAAECLRRIPLEQRIRLLGVRVGNLQMAVAPAREDDGQGCLAFD